VWVKENFEHLVPNPPEVTAGEVRMMARAAD
jgi:hypothetical protein